jgi:hypothetical protein
VVAAIVIVVTVFGAWVLWAALGAATPDVRSELVSFRVRADGVRTSFDATGDAHRAISCTLQAEDRDREPVGIRRVTLPPGAEATRRASTFVSTRARAVTVVIVGCRLGPAANR